MVESTLYTLYTLYGASVESVSLGVGGETTFHCRLVGDVSVDQRVGDSDVQQRLASVSVEVVHLEVALPLRAVSSCATVAASMMSGGVIRSR
eukprot:COSAG02_NODE_125_length_34972_cov_101.069997_20_plen_92_part_00